jgi:hypothetical protein
MTKANKVTRGKVSKTELAYIAGFLDGEGWITLYKSKDISRKKYPRFEYQVGICNNNKGVINWLYDTFGGSIRTRNKQNLKWQDNYLWKLSSNQASDFLKLILPYMRLKNNQAELAIEFQEKRKLKKNRFKPMTEEEYEYANKCWEKMRKLNYKFNNQYRIPPAETKRKNTER